ncbi:hypothetical protein [Akkermansia massiliensis]
MSRLLYFLSQSVDREIFKYLKKVCKSTEASRVRKVSGAPPCALVVSQNRIILPMSGALTSAHKSLQFADLQKIAGSLSRLGEESCPRKENGSREVI